MARSIYLTSLSTVKAEKIGKAALFFFPVADGNGSVYEQINSEFIKIHL